MGGRIFVLLFIFVKILFYSNASPVAAADPNPDLRINIQVIQKIGGLKSTTSKPSATLISTNTELGLKSTTSKPSAALISTNTELDQCPNSKFTDNYVCSTTNGGDCTNVADAKAFVIWINPVEYNYIVFSNKDFENEEIDYTEEGADCQIKNDVFAWGCKYVKQWKCNQLGYCTGKSTLNDGTHISHNCPCPNPSFNKKHVCKKCTNAADAVTHTNTNRPGDKGPNHVFGDVSAITYEKVQGTKELVCKINENVHGWVVTPPKEGSDKWEKEDLGICSYVAGTMTTGHLDIAALKCTPKTTKSVAFP